MSSSTSSVESVEDESCSNECSASFTFDTNNNSRGDKEVSVSSAQSTAGVTFAGHSCRNFLRKLTWNWASRQHANRFHWASWNALWQSVSSDGEVVEDPSGPCYTWLKKIGHFRERELGSITKFWMQTETVWGRFWTLRLASASNFPLLYKQLIFSTLLRGTNSVKPEYVFKEGETWRV